MVTRQELKRALTELGVEKEMILEVHSSLSSFGQLEGGAMTVIDTLKELVTDEGSIFMPALRLSRELPLTDRDRELGITVKIKVLDPDAPTTAMGVIADTFRLLPDTVCGRDTISTAGWGKHAREASRREGAAARRGHLQADRHALRRDDNSRGHLRDIRDK